MTKHEFKDLKCPKCVLPMALRIQNTEHVNVVTKKVSKHRHYQYYCAVCDDGDTGWTTTESDELSMSL